MEGMDDSSLQLPLHSMSQPEGDDEGKQMTDTEIKFDKLYEHRCTNYSSNERTFELLNNFFIVCEGWLEAVMVSSNQIELPFESELVSALWLVTVSGGAKVDMGILHCMKLSVKNMTQIGMVTARINGKKPLRLSYNNEASFSCRNACATLKLPPVNEDATYLIGVVKRLDTLPTLSGILSFFSSSKLVCQYSYLVFYQYRRQTVDVNYNHWRVHILSFKNICGLGVSFY